MIDVKTLKDGFSRTFWVANVIELFERFAYYGAKAILAIYLAEKVGLGPEVAGTLLGVFTYLLYFMPLLAGTIVDRYGFKKSLLVCFTIFCLGYSLLGLAGMAYGEQIVAVFGKLGYVSLVLLLTAMGGSLIKPCIVGTVARTTTPDTKSLGYSIYYMLVNIGGAIGPLLAVPVRENFGIEYVLLVSAGISFLNILGTLIFYKEPPRPADAPPPKSFGQVLADALLVFTNLRFMSFLLIFSGFWMMFWQIFFALPAYVRDVLKYPRFEIIETVDAIVIIFLTVPLTALANKLRPITAMTLGFGIASLSWFLMGAFTSITVTVVAIAFFAVGEATQAPRFYEYVADLAPKEQVGTYMGFAFLPVAIGALIAGPLSGYLVKNYVGSANPGMMWVIVGCIGVASTICMLLYNAFIAPKKAEI